MFWRSVFLALLWPVPVFAASLLPPPYKEPLARPDRLEQAAVYVATDPRGIGLEFQNKSGRHLGSNAIASLGSGNILPLVFGTAIDGVLSAKPLARIQDIANQMGGLIGPAAAQAEFEAAVAESLSRMSVPGATLATKKLPEGKLAATSFDESRALVLQLTYSLTPDVRRVHVAVTVEAFDKQLQSEASSGGKSTAGRKAGRAFRNRFEYFSEGIALLPPKTDAEIAIKVADVEAKYASDKSPEAERKKSKELELARQRKRTAEEHLEHFVAEWTANEGQKLKDDLRVAMRGAMELFEQDVTDTAALAEPQKNRLGEVLATANERETYRRLGEDAGVLLSWPRGVFSLEEYDVRHREQSAR
jgi:hypothetical protein